MPDILVDPLNLNYVLVGIAALTSAGYFIRVRDKSASTWYMLAFLAAWAFYALNLAFWAFTHDSITADARFYTSIHGRITLIGGALAGPMLAQAGYRFRGNPFRREANLVLVLSIIVIFATILSLIDTPTSAVGAARWLVAFWAFWGVVVLLRKRSYRGHTEWTARDKAGILAVALFLLVVTISETFTGFNLILGSARSVGLFLLGQVLQFTVVLAFPVVYVQYAPEPTTFQVKLVGFVLLIVLAVFGVLNAYQSAMDDQRQAFDPAAAPHTVMFSPIGTQYQISQHDLSFESDIGTDLRLLDDDAVVIDLPFIFPFAGRSLSKVVVDANGAIQPGEVAYPFQNFSGAFPTVSERALIAVWFTDLNPGASGSVHANILPDRLVVTWKDVPEWNYYLPFTLQAVLHESGEIDFNYAALPFDTYVGATGVLTNPNSFDPAAANTFESISDMIGAGPVENPISIFDRRREFKEYLHRETMPFVWVVFGTIAFILLVAPLFFRLSLTRPLDRLMLGMQRVNDGDLEAELPLGVKDEFGFLAMHFNKMTKSLQTYSEEMESLVANRTQELNKSLESLKATQEQLVQQEKMASLGQLTAGIAHEIKNPLNFINNFAELNAELADELLEAIEKGEDSSELVSSLRENAKVIAEHGKRADSIVKSMMEHARRGSSPMEPVEVNAFVDEYVNLAFHGHRAATPDFTVNLKRLFGEDVGSVPMIRQDIARVLINLLGNAFDAVAGYMPLSDNATTGTEQGDSGSEQTQPYEPTVTVTTRREHAPEGGRDQVVIEVADNGPGVPPEAKQKIFEPFFTTKPPGKGTGLGLSLSYDIIASGHGGSLALMDTKGGGATFVVALPA